MSTIIKNAGSIVKDGKVGEHILKEISTVKVKNPWGGVKFTGAKEVKKEVKKDGAKK
jgi:hypothetical protein